MNLRITPEHIFREDSLPRLAVITSTGIFAPKSADNREAATLERRSWHRRVGLRRSVWRRIAAAKCSTWRDDAAFNWARTGPVLLALLLCSCVPTTTDTVPLQQASLAPLQSESISSGGYRIEALPIGEKPADLLVLVAMSGGGKRSAAYSYGA